MTNEDNTLSTIHYEVEFRLHANDGIGWRYLDEFTTEEEASEYITSCRELDEEHGRQEDEYQKVKVEVTTTKTIVS